MLVRRHRSRNPEEPIPGAAVEAPPRTGGTTSMNISSAMRVSMVVASHASRARSLTTCSGIARSQPPAMPEKCIRLGRRCEQRIVRARMASREIRRRTTVATATDLQQHGLEIARGRCTLALQPVARTFALDMEVRVPWETSRRPRLMSAALPLHTAQQLPVNRMWYEMRCSTCGKDERANVARWLRRRLTRVRQRARGRSVRH